MKYVAFQQHVQTCSAEGKELMFRIYNLIQLINTTAYCWRASKQGLRHNLRKPGLTEFGVFLLLTHTQQSPQLWDCLKNKVLQKQPNTSIHHNFLNL